MAWRAILSKHVNELRFFVSVSEESSAAARNYIHNNYNEFKMLNPATPFLVRKPRPGGSPYMIATYDWGKEIERSLAGLTEEQIDELMKDVVEVGKTLPRYNFKPHADIPKPIVNSMPKDPFD